MKRILVTLATFFSSQVFAAGNIQAMQGRFMVNSSRCNIFQKNTPSRAFISARSADTLLLEFIGSEARQIIIPVEDHEDMERSGRTSAVVKWNGVNSLTATKSFVNDRGVSMKETIVIDSTPAGLTISQTTENRPTVSCELLRNR